MPLIVKYTNPVAGVWKIDESADELLAMLPNPEVHLLALSGISNGRRRLERLATRVLLKFLAGEGDAPMIAYRPTGAPYLPEGGRYISISHTRGYAAVAISDSPTGIDVEYASDRAARVKERFLAPDELSFIDRKHEWRHTLVCWCAKEALYKCIGEVGIDFREQLRLLPFPCLESGGISAVAMVNGGRVDFRLNYFADRFFTMAWLPESSAIKG